MKHKGVSIDSTKNVFRRRKDRNTPLCFYCEHHSVTSLSTHVEYHCEKGHTSCRYVRGTRKCKFVRK